MSYEYIYGWHAVTHALETHPESVSNLYLSRAKQEKRQQTAADKPAPTKTQKLSQDLAALAHVAEIAVTWMDKEAIARMVGEVVHQGVVARVRKLPRLVEQDLPRILQAGSRPWFFLILDGVQDPHNLGACLRTASAAGVSAVLAPKDRAADLTPLVRKIASGAAELIPFIQVTNLARSMKLLREAGVWLYGFADSAEENLYETDVTGDVGLVLGAEGQGLRRLTQTHCDRLLHIPMASAVSSLNVSVAAGVALFEVVRQRIIG